MVQHKKKPKRRPTDLKPPPSYWESCSTYPPPFLVQQWQNPNTSSSLSSSVPLLDSVLPPPPPPPQSSSQNGPFSSGAVRTNAYHEATSPIGNSSRASSSGFIMTSSDSGGVTPISVTNSTAKPTTPLYARQLTVIRNAPSPNGFPPQQDQRIPCQCNGCGGLGQSNDSLYEEMTNYDRRSRYARHITTQEAVKTFHHIQGSAPRPVTLSKSQSLSQRNHSVSYQSNNRDDKYFYGSNTPTSRSGGAMCQVLRSLTVCGRVANSQSRELIDDDDNNTGTSSSSRFQIRDRAASAERISNDQPYFIPPVPPPVINMLNTPPPPKIYMGGQTNALNYLNVNNSVAPIDTSTLKSKVCLN